MRKKKDRNMCGGNDRKLRGRKKIRICKEEERSKDAMRKISHGSGYFPHTYQVVGSHTSPPPPNPIEINQELIMFPMGVRDEGLGGGLGGGGWGLYWTWRRIVYGGYGKRRSKGKGICRRRKWGENRKRRWEVGKSEMVRGEGDGR